MSFKKKRWYQKSNRNKQHGRVIITKGTRRCWDEIISKRLIVKRLITLKVQDKNKLWELGFAVATENWCDYFWVWWIFWVKRVNTFKINSNRPKSEARAIMKSMKHVRRINFHCEKLNFNHKNSQHFTDFICWSLNLEGRGGSRVKKGVKRECSIGKRMKKGTASL